MGNVGARSGWAASPRARNSCREALSWLSRLACGGFNSEWQGQCHRHKVQPEVDSNGWVTHREEKDAASSGRWVDWASAEWLPYDFVEIGTSDFRTLSQFLDGSDRTCSMGYALRSWNPYRARGLAVEPVRHLLDRLGALPSVEKANVAMGSRDGTATGW